MAPSLEIIALAAFETLGVSLPTVDGTWGTLPAGRLKVCRGNHSEVTMSAPIDPVS